MGTKTPVQLLADWKLEKITAEQAIGHILQNMIRLEREIHELNQKLYELTKRDGTNYTQGK